MRFLLLCKTILVLNTFVRFTWCFIYWMINVEVGEISCKLYTWFSGIYPLLWLLISFLRVAYVCWEDFHTTMLIKSSCLPLPMFGQHESFQMGNKNLDSKAIWFFFLNSRASKKGYIPYVAQETFFNYKLFRVLYLSLCCLNL